MVVSRRSVLGGAAGVAAGAAGLAPASAAGGVAVVDKRSVDRETARLEAELVLVEGGGAVQVAYLQGDEIRSGDGHGDSPYVSFLTYKSMSGY